MRLLWKKEVHGQLRYMENGANSGCYRRLSRGYWIADLSSDKTRVKVVYATNERDIKRLVREWVSIPF